MRTFIAVPLNKSVCYDLVCLQRQLESPAWKVKWVEEENFHLTLYFLGEITKQQISSVQKLLYQASRLVDVFPIKFVRLGTFPPKGTPKVIWVGVSAPDQLYQLHAEIGKGLREQGLFNDTKTFKPHITVGRVKEVRDRLAAQSLVRQQAQGNWGQQQVCHIALMASDLTPSGSIYHRLSTFPLG